VRRGWRSRTKAAALKTKREMKETSTMVVPLASELSVVVICWRTATEAQLLELSPSQTPYKRRDTCS